MVVGGGWWWWWRWRARDRNNPLSFPPPPPMLAVGYLLSKLEVVSTTADRQVLLVSLLRQLQHPAQRPTSTNCTAILCLCLLAGAMRAVRSRSRCNALRFRRGTARPEGSLRAGTQERRKERKANKSHINLHDRHPSAISRSCFSTTCSTS